MLISLHQDASLTLLESPHEPLGTIKGKDKMFYTSDTETFSLKKVSTSNSLLLLDKEKAFLFQEYWELTKIPGQISELQALLEAVPFKGVQEEKRALDNYGQEYLDALANLTWESLQDLPVSDNELKMELKKRNAFLYNECYRVLDHGYTNQLLLLIKLSVIEDSLDWDNLSWNALQSLKDHDVPREILKHVLEIVSTEYYQESNDLLYKVSQKEWGRIIAENGFMNKNWNGLGTQEFIGRWGDLVPEGFEVDLSWLKGMSFTNDGKIYYFPRSVLEVDPKKRFHQLFQAKKKWTREELAPFLQDIVTGKGLDTLLVKWTRRIKDGNVYYYVAR